MSESFKVGEKVTVRDVPTVPRHRVGMLGVIESIGSVPDNGSQATVYRIKAADGDLLLLRFGEFSKDGD